MALTKTENSLSITSKDVRSGAAWSVAVVTDELLSSDHDAKQVQLSDCHFCSCSGQRCTAHTTAKVNKVGDFALIFWYCHLIYIIKIVFQKTVFQQTYGWRCFSLSGSTVWSSLPDYLRPYTTLSLDVFRHYLKSYLFAHY